VADGLPEAVRAAGARLELGRSQRRYRLRPMLAAMLLPFPLAVTVGTLYGGATLLSVAFGSITAVLVVWAVLIRRNRSVYVFDEGLVLVNSLGKISSAWPWREFDRVSGVSASVNSVRRRDYMFSHAEPGVSFVLNTLEMTDVHDLAEHVARRVRDSRQERLTAGEPVRFGVFEIAPTTLRHIPVELRDRPSVPVTVAWSQVTRVGVEDPNIVVVLVDGRQLTDLDINVSDPELFMATAEGFIAKFHHSGERVRPADPGDPVHRRPGGDRRAPAPVAFSSGRGRSPSGTIGPGANLR
jgi:hypothetical protein